MGRAVSYGLVVSSLRTRGVLSKAVEKKRGCFNDANICVVCVCVCLLNRDEHVSTHS